MITGGKLTLYQRGSLLSEKVKDLYGDICLLWQSEADAGLGIEWVGEVLGKRIGFRHAGDLFLDAYGTIDYDRNLRGIRSITVD